MIRKYNEQEQALKDWLEKNHPDVLQELEEILANPPGHQQRYDLVNLCDDEYPNLYFYYCEYTQ